MIITKALEKFFSHLDTELDKQIKILKYRNKALDGIVKDLQYPKDVARKQSALLMERLACDVRDIVSEVVRSELAKVFQQDRKEAIREVTKGLEDAEGVHVRLSRLQSRLDDVQARLDGYWEKIRDKG